MNKWIAMLVMTGLGMGTGTADERSPAGHSVAALEPGMRWKVESLPAGQSVLALADRSDAAAREKATGQPDATVVEENLIGNGFRLQKKVVNPGGLQTFLFQEDRYFVQLADGVSYSIDFPDVEMPGGFVSSSRLREFDWVKPRWWTGARMVEGVECDVYARLWPAGTTDPETAQNAGTGEMEYVAIAQADRFPRRWESPAKTYRYILLPRASPPPELPPAAEAAARELQERLEKQRNRYRIPQ